MASREFIFKCKPVNGHAISTVFNGYFEITPVSGVVDVSYSKGTCTVLCQQDEQTKKYATASVKFFPSAKTRKYDIYDVWHSSTTEHRDLVGEFDYQPFLIGGDAPEVFRNGGTFEFEHKDGDGDSRNHQYIIKLEELHKKYIFSVYDYAYVHKIFVRAVARYTDSNGNLLEKAYSWHQLYGRSAVSFSEDSVSGDPYSGTVIYANLSGLSPALVAMENLILEFYYDVDEAYCKTEYNSPDHPFRVYADGTVRTSNFEEVFKSFVSGVDVRLNFDANGGTGLSFNTKVCEFGEYVGDLPTATRKGHTLSGWKSGTLSLASDTRITWIDIKTFLAQWAALPPGVLHIVLGSGIASAAYLLESASDWVSVDANTDVSVPAETSTKVFAIPSRGYIYEHWNKDTALSVQLASDAEETFSPVGTVFEGEVQVFLNPCGGALDIAKIIKTLAVGADYEPLESPTYQGYNFLGWFDKEDGGEQIEGYVMRSDDHEIFAHWEELPAPPEKVYFNPVGGVCATEYIELDVGSAIGTLPSATKDGYRFVGWFTKVYIGEQVLPTTKVPDLGMTVYARWEKI